MLLSCEITAGIRMNSLALKQTRIFSPAIFTVFLLIVAAAVLAGSISTGAELTLKSHDKQILTEVERYKTAFKRFEVAYQAVPGDMMNASNYWNNCRYLFADCNGNGDSIIADTPEADITPEAALAWQHLALAGLIEKAYSGDLIGDYYVPGENMPAGSYPDSGYLLSSSIAYSRAEWKNQHFIVLGGLSDWRFNRAIANADDIKNLDIKSDDGIASSGKIMAYSQAADGCLQDVNRAMLVGKQAAHYAQSPHTDAKCQAYFSLN